MSPIVVLVEKGYLQPLSSQDYAKCVQETLARIQAIKEALKSSALCDPESPPS